MEKNIKNNAAKQSPKLHETVAACLLLPVSLSEFDAESQADVSSFHINAPPVV